MHTQSIVSWILHTAHPITAVRVGTFQFPELRAPLAEYQVTIGAVLLLDTISDLINNRL